MDPCELLANIEAQIYRVKDDALSRKEIMDRIDRWLSACDEEKWLEDYNQVSFKYQTLSDRNRIVRILLFNASNT